jgi:hypothetical protein
MKITKKEDPELFKTISNFIIDESYRQHRRGSNFFVKSIVEFELEDAEYFPNIKDFSKYIGTWETNTYITSEEDTNWDEIYQLTKVELHKQPKTIMENVWIEIN